FDPHALIYLATMLGIFVLGKWVYDLLTPYKLNEQLVEVDNRAVAVSFAGYLLGLGIILEGVVSQEAANVATGSARRDLLLDVGDTLLIESEQLFVSERATKDTGTNVTTDLTADASGTTVAVGDGTKVNKGEVILVGSEKMLVTDVTDNNLTVQRAVDGSVLAAHSQPVDVFAYRSLTVTRGVNGTTAATHDDSTAITKYQAPFPIRQLARAQPVRQHEDQRDGQDRGEPDGRNDGVEHRLQRTAQVGETTLTLAFSLARACPEPVEGERGCRQGSSRAFVSAGLRAYHCSNSSRAWGRWEASGPPRSW
ncbi:MAG: DUF350 domain-containing protein, partial [Chloroflexi bacterium]|nr:DUF350 domain-containing protein [Chloroflexota bacterium]